jgi:hypothetical protein
VGRARIVSCVCHGTGGEFLKLLGSAYARETQSLLNLKFFIVGTCGMVGGDDVLACFVAGNVFTLEYV